MGPSGITSQGKRKAHVMSEQDIADVIAAFAQAALDAKRIGFDGIEVHGAHGYLLDQFFWDVTNERTDRYGGSLEKRLQFVIEIVKACRQQVGEDFPIALRFSQWKQQNYSARLAQTPDELARFLLPLSDAGVDLFHASTRRFWEPEFADSALNLAGWTKQITGKPTITVGSVGLNTDFIEAGLSPVGAGQTTVRQIDDLLERLARNEFDLVAVGRALLQDPAWAIKIRDGRLDEIRDFSRDALATLY
jgi:2,4-dienoyl-CoA reductase-like NADH-dependent reductase (Old Yellow Enzyme family)